MIGWTLCRLNRCAAARPHFEAARDRASSSQLRVYAMVGLANADLADGTPDVALLRLEALRPMLDGEFAGDVELHAEVDWLMARASLDGGREHRQVRECLDRAIDGYAGLSVAPDIAVDLVTIAKALGDE